MFLIEKWKDEKMIFPTSQITYLGVLDSKPEKLSAWQIKFRTLLVLAYRTPNLEGFYTANVLFLYFHISLRFYTDDHADTSPSSSAGEESTSSEAMYTEQR